MHPLCPKRSRCCYRLTCALLGAWTDNRDNLADLCGSVHSSAARANLQLRESLVRDTQPPRAPPRRASSWPAPVVTYASLFSLRAPVSLLLYGPDNRSPSSHFAPSYLRIFCTSPSDYLNHISMASSTSNPLLHLDSTHLASAQHRPQACSHLLSALHLMTGYKRLQKQRSGGWRLGVSEGVEKKQKKRKVWALNEQERKKRVDLFVP